MTADAGVQVTELRAEDHACLTFGESEELFDLTASFIRDGLAAGLKVVWLGEAGPGVAAGGLSSRGVTVETALASGQMTAAGWKGRLLSGQVSRADTAVGGLAGEVESSRSPGFCGRCPRWPPGSTASGSPRLPGFGWWSARLVTGER